MTFSTVFSLLGYQTHIKLKKAIVWVCSQELGKTTCMQAVLNNCTLYYLLVLQYNYRPRVQSMCDSSLTHSDLWYLCPVSAFGFDKETLAKRVLQ